MNSGLYFVQISDAEALPATPEQPEELKAQDGEFLEDEEEDDICDKDYVPPPTVRANNLVLAPPSSTPVLRIQKYVCSFIYIYITFNMLKILSQSVQLFFCYIISVYRTALVNQK